MASKGPRSKFDQETRAKRQKVCLRILQLESLYLYLLFILDGLVRSEK